MRTRILLSALVIGGLWAGAARTQDDPSSKPDPAPEGKLAADGDKPAPKNGPLPKGKLPVLREVPPADPPTSLPPTLVELEAKAEKVVPPPKIPEGRAPVAQRAAEAAAEVRRAAWVVEQLLPDPPIGVPRLGLTVPIEVGGHGFVDIEGDVVGYVGGIAIVRPEGIIDKDVVVGLPAPIAPEAKRVAIRGSYAVDRRATIEGRNVPVLEPLAEGPPVKPTLEQVIALARIRLAAAQARYTAAVDRLAEAKEKEVKAALDEGMRKAAEQIKVSEDAPGPERIKAKADQQDLGRKLALPKLKEIAQKYGEVPRTFR